MTTPTSPTIVIVDDDEDTRELLADSLRRRNFDAHSVASAAECLELMRARTVDVVLTDVQMPGTTGVQLCELLRDRYPDVLSIVLTGLGDLQTGIAAIRAGAYDFVTKPVRTDILEAVLRRATDHLSVRREAKRLTNELVTTPPPGIIGSSPALRDVSLLVRRVATSDATVLITGESGTGKELVARALHELSPRAKEPFVAINCGAMPASLLESELFGHVRGAFTDAKTSRAGLFLQAGAGTIFLDEIGEMPLEMQVKLLRVLQQRTVRPVGGDDEIPFEARVVTATNRDLEEEVEAGRFREDLFYRINVVAIPVPPLRDRAGDVLAIARHVLDKIAARTNKRALTISEAAARKLVDYSWPGNVRELENCIERAVALTSGPEIGVEHLPKRVQDFTPQRIEVSTTPEQLITLEEMERRYVRQVLARMNGNKTHTARALGIDRRSLYRRLEEPRSNSSSSSSSSSSYE